MIPHATVLPIAMPNFLNMYLLYACIYFISFNALIFFGLISCLAENKYLRGVITSLISLLLAWLFYEWLAWLYIVCTKCWWFTTITYYTSSAAECAMLLSFLVCFFHPGLSEVFPKPPAAVTCKIAAVWVCEQTTPAG